MPPHQLTVMQSINEHSEHEMRKRRAQLLHPVKDFRKYISTCTGHPLEPRKRDQNSNLIFHFNFLFHLDSKQITENGIITQMRADWILPDEKKLEVTLKILNDSGNLTVSFVGQLAPASRFRMRLQLIYLVSFGDRNSCVWLRNGVVWCHRS